MTLTSLGIATDGLLDVGALPSLHIATEGLIRSGTLGKERKGAFVMPYGQGKAYWPGSDEETPQIDISPDYREEDELLVAAAIAIILEIY